MIDERKLILQRLEEVAPEHINGYLNGWLTVKHFTVEEVTFIHISTTKPDGKNSIITVVSF